MEPAAAALIRELTSFDRANVEHVGACRVRLSATVDGLALAALAHADDEASGRALRLTDALADLVTAIDGFLEDASEPRAAFVRARARGALAVLDELQR